MTPLAFRVKVVHCFRLSCNLYIYIFVVFVYLSVCDSCTPLPTNLPYKMSYQENDRNLVMVHIIFLWPYIQQLHAKLFAFHYLPSTICLLQIGKIEKFALVFCYAPLIKNTNADLGIHSQHALR